MTVDVNLVEQSVIQIDGGIKINVDVNVEKIVLCKKHFLQSTCNCENGKYLASIMDDSTIICDEVIES